MALPPSGTTDEAFLREVDEEYRRDQLIRAGRRYGIWVAIGVVAFLVAVAGWLFYDHSQRTAAEARGEEYDAALQLAAQNQVGQAQPGLDKLAQGTDGYAAMARFTQGNLLFQQGDKKGAAAKFASIVTDAKLAQPFRDLALVRQTQAEFDTLNPQDVIQRLGTLANPDSPWFGTAGEMVAAAYLKSGKRGEAAKLYRQLSEAGTRVPDSIRERTAELAKTLSVTPTAATVQTQEKQSK
ncbi:tetratricopeptide repeat protein [uncultured Sphingomonas sp.]|uniref:tetratricopeptide repeat protein n=1 Tax=uncultured Sphingomonas sp. TaxID=158754 RepID=UPI0025E935BE|nr:tetratricopeptide repeat protein [uncultured Sphingomonas sp.]